MTVHITSTGTRPGERIMNRAANPASSAPRDINWRLLMRRRIKGVVRAAAIDPAP